MINIEKTEVFGWESAIRGMRNPLNSWDKSDTVSGTYWGTIDGHNCVDGSGFSLGPNDLGLMKRLRKAGPDHRKVLRMVNVAVDFTAPFYWWKEFDTYKVGTVANSCSTMHKIADKEFTLDDFSHEHLMDIDKEVNWDEYPLYADDKESWSPILVLEITIKMLNFYRKKYIETKDMVISKLVSHYGIDAWNKILGDSDEAKRSNLAKKYWWQMIQLLPTSYNQKRTIQLNYEVLLHIYNSRNNHKLDEWHTVCDWIEKLPYFKEICLEG